MSIKIVIRCPVIYQLVCLQNHLDISVHSDSAFQIESVSLFSSLTYMLILGGDLNEIYV